MTKQESIQWFVYELALDIDSGLVRVQELTDVAGHNERLQLIASYLHSAQKNLQDYCTGYGLRYSDENGFTLAGNKELRISDV